MNTLVSILIVVALACLVYAVRRFIKARAARLKKPQVAPPEPKLRPFILKIIEMIEKGDYSYTSDLTTPLGSGIGCREVYKFALETDLKCEVARTRSFSTEILLGVASYWWLYVDGRGERMAKPEQNAIADAITKVATARRERAQREEDAKRAPLIAAIEPYTVIDRRPQT